MTTEDVAKQFSDIDVKYLTRNHIERPDAAQLEKSQSYDPFDDDTPLVCGIEDPEHCDSCQ